MTENLDHIARSINNGHLPEPNAEALDLWLQKITTLYTADVTAPWEPTKEDLDARMVLLGYSDSEIIYIETLRDRLAVEKQTHQSYDTGPDEFLKKAKELVRSNYYDIEQLNEDSFPISLDEIYIVWFSKTLQNWKALLSTTRKDAQYFEVIYNGDKKETYIDTYVKIHNDCIPD